VIQGKSLLSLVALSASFAPRAFAALWLIACWLPCASVGAQEHAQESGRAPTSAAQGSAGRLIASPETGWPQWRGLRRDGISDEKGLLQAWPDGGPKLLWKISDLGRGWSSPIINQGTLYITGDVGDDLVIHAFDLEGRPRWRVKNGAAWKGSWPGARACLAASEGRLYHMNAHGRAACLDAKTGNELWAVNVLERFDGRNITWAIAECLLVDGPRVIVTPGGRKGMMAALDKKTGQTLWASEPIPGDKAGYSSPILFEFGGRRHLVNHSSRHAFGVDADTGKLRWSIEFVNRYEVTVSTPVFADGQVFVVAPDGPDAVLLRLGVEGDLTQVERRWASDLDSLTGGVVLVDGTIYGSGYRNFRGWRGLDWRTGKTKFHVRDLDSGAATWADGRLYILSESGTAALVKPTPAGFDFAGRFDLVARKHDAWAHPVICDGRLYLRYHETLWCFDVRAK
jgi:outer membrane protein assembly factor BamB